MTDRLEPRIRVLLGSSIAIGPGKAARFWKRSRRRALSLLRGGAWG